MDSRVAIVYFAAGKIGLPFVSFNVSSSSDSGRNRVRGDTVIWLSNLAGGFCRSLLRQPDHLRRGGHIVGYGDRQHARGGRRSVPDDALRERRRAFERAQDFFKFVGLSNAGGVESALAKRPHLAVVDIGLPGFDGYKVARRVRSVSDVPEMKLNALTDHGLPEDRRKAEQVGFDARFGKSLDFDQLGNLLKADEGPVLQRFAAR